MTPPTCWGSGNVEGTLETCDVPLKGVWFMGSFSPARALGLIRVGVLSARYDQAEGVRGLGR